VWSDARRVLERSQTFELDDVTVTVPAPEGAEFSELEGLEEGARHLTWSPAPNGYFMISAGTSPGHTAEGMLAGERERGTAPRVESDEPAPLAGEGARRVVFRVTDHRPREWREAPGGDVEPVPERDVRQLNDLLFVPGRRQRLRIGYRVEEGAAEELRSLLARMLDRVEVRRRHA
jgi:hypothetical protein